MRFKVLHIIGFAVLILLTLLLLARQSLTALLVTSIIFALVIIIKLILALIDDELSYTHALITGTLFLSLGFLIINYMGSTTITTVFLGSTLIFTYMVMIILIMVSGWRTYKAVDKLVDVMSAEQKQQKKESLPAQALIEEPPRFTAKKSEEGEWIEIKIQKPKKTVKKAVRKATKKKSSKKSSRK